MPGKQIKRMPQKTKLTKRANDYRRAVAANGGVTNRGITHNRQVVGSKAGKPKRGAR